MLQGLLTESSLLANFTAKRDVSWKETPYSWAGNISESLKWKMQVQHQCRLYGE